MIALLDTSVVLRKLFGEADQLEEWAKITEAYASRLLLVELGRAIDRTRLAGEIDDAQVEALHREATRLLKSVEVLGLTETVLLRASGAMPTAVGSLDAIHLSTALELERAKGPGVVLGTHDVQLARAARASGLTVAGA